MKRVSIYASLLAVEHTDTLREWRRVASVVHGVHIDFMDGKFVKQRTRFTPAFIRSLKTKKVKDVHLMVESPERVIPACVRAGADIIDIHIETLKSPLTSLMEAKRKFPKLKIFLSLNPETPATVVYPYLPLIDGILCMTVRPGLGGQKFIAPVLRKIRTLRKRAKKIPIMVDGGVNPATAKRVRAAGATILVSGTYLFHHLRPRQAIRALTL